MKLTTTIKGLHYRVKEETIRVMSDVLPLDARLEREPENSFDENAIKVVLCDKPWEDFHVAYISREVAKELAPKLDSGALEISNAVIVALDHDAGEGEITIRGFKAHK